MSLRKSYLSKRPEGGERVPGRGNRKCKYPEAASKSSHQEHLREGETGGISHRVQNFSYTRLISPGELLYGIVPIVNNTVLYT